MGIFRILNFLLVVFSYSLAHGTQYCQIQIRDISPGDSRAHQIFFPDGREIIIVGHNHGDRSLPEELHQLTVIPLQELSNEFFLEKLSGLVETLHFAKQHLPADQSFLKRLLETQRKIQFIGFESTNAITQNNIHHYSLLHAGFIRNLKLRGLHLSPDLSDLLLVAVGPVASLRIREPELFNHRRILGFESEAATKAYALASDDVDAIRTRLNEASRGDKEFQRNIRGTDLQLWQQYDHYVPDRDETAYLASITSARIPAAYRELTLEWSRARLKEMRELKRREKDVVDNMIATEKSGVLFMGYKHLVSLSQILFQKCQNTY
ncbi:MAG: hypothetical protein K2Q26_06575 [Bdellovibrionales bacterium]|nr:hypothetical protein [Bdellovibrionales bacterium]